MGKLQDHPTAGTSTTCAPLPLTLFGSGPPAVNNAPRFIRVNLDPCCWVDYVEQFIVGGDSLFEHVVEHFDWHRGERLMYGNWLDEPRLTAKPSLSSASVPAVVRQAVSALESHYDRPFKGLFCNFYQRGDDSVAWHADQIGRTNVDPLVAIISLGGPRTFAMRDSGANSEESTSSSSGPGRATRRWTLHSGDLLVMGGATQHHWEHSVPKAKGAPPRISLTTRATTGGRAAVRAATG